MSSERTSLNPKSKSTIVAVIGLCLCLLLIGNQARSNSAIPEFQELLDALRYESQQTRSYQQLTPPGKGEAAATAWMEDLQSQDRKTRYRAALILGILGRQAPARATTLAPALARTLKTDPVPQVRYSAALALGNLGQTAPEREAIVLPLLQGTTDENSEVRDASLIALSRIGTQDSRVIPALVASMEDVDGAVRDTGAEVLASWASQEPEALRGLVVTLKQGKKLEARSVAAYGMGKMGKHGSLAVPSLIDALTDEKEARVRASVIIALGRIGGQANNALIAPALVQALADKEPGIRQMARNWLVSLSKTNEYVVPALLEGLQAAKPAMRRQSAFILQRVPTDIDPLIPPLITCLKDSQASVRRQAALTLGRLSPPNAHLFSELVAAFAQGSPQVRHAAALALQQQELPALAAILPLLGHAEPEVRWEAWQLAVSLSVKPLGILSVLLILAVSAKFWFTPKQLILLLFPVGQ